MSAKSPVVSAEGISARILELLADGQPWPVARLGAKLGVAAKSLSPTLSSLTKSGVLRRAARGVYAKGTVTPTVKPAELVPAGARVPTPDAGGLTPLERATVLAGKTRASFGSICSTGGSRGSQDPPTAAERILAALGSGPKKWGSLLDLCSLTNQGASEAMAALARAGKVTSWHGVWKLTAAPLDGEERVALTDKGRAAIGVRQ